MRLNDPERDQSMTELNYRLEQLLTSGDRSGYDLPLLHGYFGDKSRRKCLHAIGQSGDDVVRERSLAVLVVSPFSIWHSIVAMANEAELGHGTAPALACRG